MKETAILSHKIQQEETNKNFRKSVILGLTAEQKYLDPKYFYDAKGDELFRKIMACPEYYLTACERQILQQQKEKILETCTATTKKIDIVELGAGDASKSIPLLKAAYAMDICNHYYPIDISDNIIRYLSTKIPESIPGLQVHGMTGEYFPMLKKISKTASRNKLVLFLGSTIGNMLPEDALSFCKELHQFLNEGDFLLIGFDIKKDPDTILAAYNDAQGITKAFNLNLLKRINRELAGNFNTNRFLHYPLYDPGTGACKSYLISTEKQTVLLGRDIEFQFEQHEAIYMEVSQKYDYKEMDKMAVKSGFQPLTSFQDKEKMFVDALWQIPFSNSGITVKY